MLDINGRVTQKGKFVGRAILNEQGNVSIRIDHNKDLAFWLEIEIEREDLDNLLAGKTDIVVTPLVTTDS